MTIQNYTNCSDSELCDLVYKLNPHYAKTGGSLIQHRYGDLFAEIVERTKFLYANIPFAGRIYCLKHGLSSPPICQYQECSNIVKWRGNKFRNYCCKNHGYLDPKRTARIEDGIEKKFGVRHALQSDVLLEKAKKTTFEHYGVENPFQLDYAIENSMKTLRMNKDNIQEKTRHTNLERLGVEYPMQSKCIQKKSMETCVGKYGVHHYSQTIEFASKRRKKLYHDGKWFDSSWEIKVYDFLQEKRVSFEYAPSISIPYEYDEKTFYYYPDFRVGDRIVEVKGDQFFRMNEETGKEEMFCPYRKPQWDDDRYFYECAKYEAKHQCMIANGVVILRGSDIDHDIESSILSYDIIR